jgi:cytochrome c oxidase subunit II
VKPAYVIRLGCLCVPLLLCACSGIQSALDPAGREAARIADIFWWMTIGTVIVWVSVIILALWAVKARPEAQNLRRLRFLIIGGGAVIPTIVLTILLIYGLAPMPVLLAPAPEGSLRIAVSGEQWWWRVRYLPPAGQEFETANEIHLPVGEPVQFILDSPDVIHSFWIPSLAGKIDMIPGRITRLAIRPTKTGIFRGVCAEYCGTSHALMNFYVVVQSREEFNRWIQAQAAPAVVTTERVATKGRELFFANGCGGCHTIDGTSANGIIGPELTHVGSRLSIAAGTLPNEVDDFRRWVAHTKDIKPGVKMPPFHMLPKEELHALAVYLNTLK